MMTTSQRRIGALSVLAAVLLVAGLAVADSRLAGPQEPLTIPGARDIERARVEQAHISALLDMIHEIPAKERFEQASPRARDVVWQIARDEATIGPRRYAALEAMAYYWHGPEVERYMLGELQATDTPEGLRHRVLMWIADTSDPGRASEILVPWLAHRQSAMRLTAIEALGRVRSEAALSALRTHASTSASKLERQRALQAARYSPMQLR